ncbi:MAG TPA: hypothetical protein VJQ42_11125, partial [Rhodanobacteraceae bacterium]|nr:hypothetical protein [Rhodanobacteraceae bacterium]
NAVKPKHYSRPTLGFALFSPTCALTPESCRPKRVERFRWAPRMKPAQPNLPACSFAGWAERNEAQRHLLRMLGFALLSPTYALMPESFRPKRVERFRWASRMKPAQRNLPARL